MNTNRSRREFLALGLAVPATGLASAADPARWSSQPVSQSPASPVKFAYRTLGKTGLKVSPLGFGCMTTSDAGVYRTGRGPRHELLRHGARLPGRQQRAHGRRRAEGASGRTILSSKKPGQDKQDAWPSSRPVCASCRRTTSISGTCTSRTAAEVTDDLLEAQQVAKKPARSASPASARTRGTRS